MGVPLKPFGPAMRRLVALVIALAGALTATPALAAPADPAASVVWVQAPTLAPGTVGTAPLSGELKPDGRFVLHAAVSQAHTGNAVQEGLVRKFVTGTVSLSGDSPVRVRQLKNGQTLRMMGTIHAVGTTMRVPLFVKMSRGASGTHLRTFLRVPLSAYGVQKLGGGSAGDVSISIEATFSN
jgi:hypothetical protein